MGAEVQNILVIKLGALGDFIQALGPMAAIRKHHPKAKITLLTTRPFEGVAENCGYFDRILIDKRPGFFNFKGWLDLRKTLNDGRLDRVYDLQNNDRTALYFRLFRRANKPEWVGTARGASHRNTSPKRTAGRAFDGHVQTLGLAGIKDVEIDRLEWMKADISHFSLQKPFVLLVPGSAPHRPGKCWPAEKYGRLAKLLYSAGFQPVILGTIVEKEAAEKILQKCPEALDLSGRTALEHLAVLGREAAGVIGNDTGPMHLITATGCPALVLFSRHSDPARHAPKGAHVDILQEDDLGALKTETVMQHFQPREVSGTKTATLH